jgi:hypothetical protein
VADWQAVTGGYFRALKIPLRAGRSFVDSDDADGPQVAVINDTLATMLWPGQPAVGRRLSRSGPEGPWIDIVGVVGDVRHRALSQPAPPIIYSAYRQRGWDTMSLILAANTRPDAVVDGTRRRLAAIAPDQPIDAVASLEDLVSASTALTRLQALLLGAFGVIALVVAALGIYAVVAYAVERRLPEIAVRVALGATRLSIVWLVLRQGSMHVATGIAAGVAGAWATRNLIASVLFGVPAADPLALGGITLLLSAVAVLAMSLPARRAARLDLVRALQER